MQPAATVPPTTADNVVVSTRSTTAEGISNASLVQIVSGLTCIGLEAYLYASYHDADESILDGNTVFTFCVGVFGLMAGMLGYFVHRSRQWINFGYLAASLGVVSSSIMYFLAGYWDFYAAVKESGEFFYMTDSNVDAEEIPNNLLADGEFKFWLQAGLFICVIVLALFSLAGMAIVASYRFCHHFSSSKKEDYKSLLVD